MFLAFLIGVTIIFAMFFIGGLFLDFELSVISLMILIIIGVIGWGIFGSLVTKTTKYSVVQKSQPAVTLKDNSFIIFYINSDGKEKTQWFTNLSDLVIKDKSEYTMIHRFNMYGGLVEEHIMVEAPKDIKLEKQ